MERVLQQSKVTFNVLLTFVVYSLDVLVDFDVRGLVFVDVSLNSISMY